MGNSMSVKAPEAAPKALAAASPEACPVLEGTQQQQSSCPVPESARARAIYNVYGQRMDLPQPDGPPDPLAAMRATDVLDPQNNMPLAPNQRPCPGQRKLLSTERIESNIPKGGTSETWVYPSPQMFFNGAWSLLACAAVWRLGRFLCCCSCDLYAARLALCVHQHPTPGPPLHTHTHIHSSKAQGQGPRCA